MLRFGAEEAEGETKGEGGGVGGWLAKEFSRHLDAASAGCV